VADETEHLRWIAIVTYRVEAGPVDRSSFRGARGIAHDYRARSGLEHDVSIVVTLNPERAQYPDDTVKAAERR
jgi:hypothetical protein